MKNKTKKKIIGKIIRNARIRKKLTQLEVSKNTGISRNYISDIENGRYMPSVETLFLIAKYLEIDLNLLSKMTEIQENIS
ncbi:helix-turn-helix domain-containing protein [Caminicella sporogenes]|uniref:helix-turn-helix domain-containing protein n=1 Tax=Caminicella sporogenes TaxID=166485 RepID=UPI002541B0B1|nr:helix-turn-helix transcriptional regulator [Caminicella sporogenes]WIF95164.1 helix-turn-helix transcriptional regulator [Caminicella sporogenes]